MLSDSAPLTGKTILFVDDDADALSVLTARCTAAGMHVLTARNLLTAWQRIETHTPDIVSIDLHMPTGNGLAFCETLAGDPTTASIPRIILTGSGDAATAHRARTLGAAVVSKGPEAWPRLERELVQMLSDRDRQANATPMKCKKVVVADDDADLRRLLRVRFEELGCKVFEAEAPLDALHIIERVFPDLVCLDVEMPSGSGLSVAEMMAADPRLHSIPMIVLTGKTDPATIRRCHEMMAYYVAKSPDVWSRVEPLARDELDLPYSDCSPETGVSACLPCDKG